jgi:hypothetical protein
MPKKGQFTQERVEYKVFLFDKPLKGSKSLKIFKISLTFRFDKLSNLSKSVHTGENSQILTVSNKKLFYYTGEYLISLKIYRVHRNFYQVHVKITCSRKVIQHFSLFVNKLFFLSFEI